MEEGDTGASLYIVKQGIAVVEKGGFEMARYQKGDYFGERALMTGGPRTATVRADGALECLRLGQGQFLELMSQCAHVASLFAQQQQEYEDGNRDDSISHSHTAVICPEDAEQERLTEIDVLSAESAQTTVPD